MWGSTHNGRHGPQIMVWVRIACCSKRRRGARLLWRSAGRGAQWQAALRALGLNAVCRLMQIGDFVGSAARHPSQKKPVELFVDELLGVIPDDPRSLRALQLIPHCPHRRTHRCRVGCSHCALGNASRIFLMLRRSDIPLPWHATSEARARWGALRPNSRPRCATGSAGVQVLRNHCSSGSEQPLKFLRNRCSICSGIAVQVAPENELARVHRQKRAAGPWSFNCVGRRAAPEGFSPACPPDHWTAAAKRDTTAEHANVHARTQVDRQSDVRGLPARRSSCVRGSTGPAVRRAIGGSVVFEPARHARARFGRPAIRRLSRLGFAITSKWRSLLRIGGVSRSNGVEARRFGSIAGSAPSNPRGLPCREHLAKLVRGCRTHCWHLPAESHETGQTTRLP